MEDDSFLRNAVVDRIRDHFGDEARDLFVKVCSDGII